VRLALALTLAALVALAGGVDVASAAKHRKPCARKGSTTVVATRQVRVYEVPNREGGDHLYGCLRSSGLRRLLEDSYDDFYVTSGKYDHVRVAGRFVAWQFTATDISCKAACPPDYDPTVTGLFVRDLRARRNVTVDGEVAAHGRLVLTAHGALAWTEDSTLGVAVQAFDGSGKRTLDDGAVAPGSLRLAGSTASWTNGGEQRTATLAPRA
jgi:hypothetical protein